MKEPKFRLNQLVEFDGKHWFIKQIVIEVSEPYYWRGYHKEEVEERILYILEDNFSQQYKLVESDLEKGFSGNFRSIEEKKAAEFKESVDEKIKDLKSQINSKLGMIFWFFVPVYISGFYILGHMICK